MSIFITKYLNFVLHAILGAKYQPTRYLYAILKIETF